LARSGYYDGTKFHRIIDGFVVQGGKGVGGLTPIKGEFQNNNVRNTISHTRGAISMARGNANDSATDQFFIVHKDSTYLDGNYAGIGYITSGMEIIDKVVEDTPVEDNNGTVAAENQPVIKKITVVD
jgi:peptidyl-prolyl cis-trans isomerase B (cyclophilin B)